MKYEGRRVRKPAAVVDRAVRTALRRRGTACMYQREALEITGPGQRTGSPIAYDRVQRAHKIGQDHVGIVEASQHGDDV